MSDTRRAPEASSADAGPVGSVSRPSFKRTLTFFGFFAITASMVMTVYEYPSFASSGFQLVFFLIIGGILWFLPVALCAAEMATVKGWESGGIFAWVGNTLGRRWGFAALFFQWFQITVGFVTMAFFILAALAYVFRWDALYNNPLVMFFGVAAIVWLLTLTQLGGTKYTARISKVGFVGGIIVPVLVLLVGLVIYFATGGVSQIKMDAATFVPDFGKVDTLVIFASFILAYMGVEASASHVNELKNPNRNYPLAMIVLGNPHHRAGRAGRLGRGHDASGVGSGRQPVVRRDRGVPRHLRAAYRPVYELDRVRGGAVAGAGRACRDLGVDRGPVARAA